MQSSSFSSALSAASEQAERSIPEGPKRLDLRGNRVHLRFSCYRSTFPLRKIMANFSPWKRKRPHTWGPFHIHWNTFRGRFDDNVDANIDLDFHTKRAALKASSSVVSLASFMGEKFLFAVSGTIVDSEDINGTCSGTILTSASVLRSSSELDIVPDDIKVNVYLSDGKIFEGQVLAYDFHYNLAIVTIKSDVPLPIASLKLLDDSITVDPSEIPYPGDKEMGNKSFQLRPHSHLFKLAPGDMVVAIGRFFEEPYELMAAPGNFSADCCNFDCKELFRANCKISKCGIGGPLINSYGEVIGINFYDELCTPFLPINIASKCLDHFKKYGRFCRPWLGLEMTNLYAASLYKLETIIKKFPNIFQGVFVEEVTPGSPADSAGIQPGDVIIKCGESFVQSFLEFFGKIWDEAGKSVEVTVIRESSGVFLNLTMLVDDTTPDKFNRWPIPEEKTESVRRVRLRYQLCYE